MELRKDPLYHLVISDPVPEFEKVSCFYFSDCYFQELNMILKKNKKITSIVSGKIMTHTYFKFITRDITDIYYHHLCGSRFDIKISKQIFKQLREHHSL